MKSLQGEGEETIPQSFLFTAYILGWELNTLLYLSIIYSIYIWSLAHETASVLYCDK